MRRLQSLISILLLVLLAGCATTENFRATMNHFIGQPIDEARFAYGYNYQERALDDGRTAYTWKRIERGVSPGYRDPVLLQTEEIDGERRLVSISAGSYMPPQRYTLRCEFTFIVGRDGVIDTWRAHGDGCRSTGTMPQVLLPGN